ncbi:MAG: hypothetical protein VX710_06470 [Bacteroidota bacterium]|nr:hypothetical protein [Bacteroidota bacterium]
MVKGNTQLLDSVSFSISTPPTFFINLDTRGSFVSNRHVRLSGVKAGLNFNNKVKFGIGYNWLKTNYQPEFNNEKVDLKSKNFSTFVNYIFYSDKKVDFNANLQLGLGNLYYELHDEKVANSTAVFYEQSIAAEYRIINYFGVELGVGYRLAFYNKTQINENLSSPVYIARFKLYFGEIYKALNSK